MYIHGIRTREIPRFKRTGKELAITTQRSPLTFKLNAQMNDRKTTTPGDKYITKPNQECYKQKLSHSLQF